MLPQWIPASKWRSKQKSVPYIPTMGGGVDKAHCCDTSGSLQVSNGWHSKATSSGQGCKPTLVSQLLYRSDVLIQVINWTYLSSSCLIDLQVAHWVLSTQTYLRELTECKMKLHTERPDIALLQWCIDQWKFFQTQEIWSTLQRLFSRKREGHTTTQSAKGNTRK